MTCFTRERTNAMVSALRSPCSARANRLFFATWSERRSISPTAGIGKESRPAFSSCHTYWFAALQAALEPDAMERLARHAFGFGPAFDFPFTTTTLPPEASKATSLAHQPVGRRATARPP